jgi:hypothetical protein
MKSLFNFEVQNCIDEQTPLSYKFYLYEKSFLYEDEIK